VIGRLIRWALGLFILTSIGGAIAALIVKQRTPSEGTPESDEVSLVSIFEPLTFTSRATAFRGGSLLCLYGGGDVDLREATLDSTGADLSVRLAFGGGRLIVPDEWIVEMHVLPIIGGVADVRPPRERPADAPKLVVDGFAIFGGLAVDSTRREESIDMTDAKSAMADAIAGAKAKVNEARSAASTTVDDATASAAAKVDEATNGAAEAFDEDATELMPALDV